MTGPAPLSTRAVMLRRVAEAAIAAPASPLRRLAPQAVQVATCSAPGWIYDPCSEDALRHRATAWAALMVAQDARTQARRSLAASRPAGGAA